MKLADLQKKEACAFISEHAGMIAEALGIKDAGRPSSELLPEILYECLFADAPVCPPFDAFARARSVREDAAMTTAERAACASKFDLLGSLWTGLPNAMPADIARRAVLQLEPEDEPAVMLDAYAILDGVRYRIKAFDDAKEDA